MEVEARDGTRRLLWWSAYGCALLVTAWLAAGVWSQRTNVLHGNDRWVSTKLELERGVPGAIGFVTTRTALAGGELDLGTWFGYHEVWTRRPVSFSRVACSVRVADWGYVVVQWRHGDVLHGVRLSRRPDLPSAILTVSPAGRFLASEPVQDAVLADGWCRVELDHADESCRVGVDGREWGRVESIAGPSFVGFRGGQLPSSVDDVRIEEQGTNLVEVETFSGRRAPWAVVWIALLLVAARVKELDAATPRVVFAGSSQTWGAGATCGADTFVERLEKRLDRPDRPVACVNTSVSGWCAEDVLAYHREHVGALDAAVLVVVLGSNDQEPVALADALRELLRLHRRRGARALVVLEANSWEVPTALARKHDAMRAVIGEESVPCVDLHEALVSRREEGFLWWDFVHPTSFGHELIADALEPVLERVLADAAAAASTRDGHQPR